MRWPPLTRTPEGGVSKVSEGDGPFIPSTGSPECFTREGLCIGHLPWTLSRVESPSLRPSGCSTPPP